MSHQEGNGWYEWKNHVLATLQEFREDQKAIADKVDRLHDEVLVMQTRSIMFGVLAGGVGSLLLTLLAAWLGN